MGHDTSPTGQNQREARAGAASQDELRLKNRALDEAAEGITIADARLPDQPLIYVNEGFERLTGYSADDVVGRNCRFLQGDDTDPATVDKIRHAVTKGQECIVEILNYHKDGTPFWNRLSITPIKDSNGTVTHFIGVQSDITARKNAEARLREANRRIKEDLDLAAEIQQGFLPDKRHRVDGAEIAWDLRSCDELGGDTLNVVQLDERNVEFYTIDVSGHGVPAALLSVTLNHFLSPAGGRMAFPGRSQENIGRRGEVSPSDMAAILNKQFPYDMERNQFFTLAYGVYNLDERLFRFVAAGHPPPIHVPRSGASQCDWVAGPPIGIVPEYPYEQNTLQLTPGDRVYLYSDGLIDVKGEDGELFGEERLTRVLEQLRDKPLDDTVQAAVAEVEKWGRNVPFDDDVSILAFEAE